MITTGPPTRSGAAKSRVSCRSGSETRSAWKSHAAAFLLGIFATAILVRLAPTASKAPADVSTAATETRKNDVQNDLRTIRVVDAATGLSINGARLRWRGASGEIESDIDEGIARVLDKYEAGGWFRESGGGDALSNGLPPTVVVTAEGFAPQSFTLPLHPFGAEPLLVRPAWTVALRREGPELVVTVVEAESKRPLSGATVLALHSGGEQYVDLGPRPCTAYAAIDRGGIPHVKVPSASIVGTGVRKTDQAGSARLRGLPAVDWLRLLAIDDARKRIGLSRSFTLDGTFATTVLELPTVRGSTVRGVLSPGRRSDEPPMACVMRGNVSIGDVTAALLFVAMIDEDGRFEFPTVPSGEYGIAACRRTELLDAELRFLIGSRTVVVAGQDVSVKLEATR